jgi:hypothetical protein
VCIIGVQAFHINFNTVRHTETHKRLIKPNHRFSHLLRTSKSGQYDKPLICVEDDPALKTLVSFRRTSKYPRSSIPGTPTYAATERQHLAFNLAVHVCLLAEKE